MTDVPPDVGPVDRLVAGSRVREWEVVRFVARGAFGQVFEARRDTWVGDQPNRAIKVFDPILSSAARSSLLDEFGVLRSVRHRHLVAGEDAFDLVDGPLAGCVVFVMELASTDLASLSARNGPLPATQVASIGAQLATGLAALHGADRLHGDVKPENVLSVDDTWKLGDFGVVSTLQGSYASPIGATLDFRPPELSQPDGAVRVHRSADVWALGVTLWLATTGEHPFVGSDPQLRYAAVLRGDRRPRPVLDPALDPALADLLEQRCLAPDPRDRASAAELAAELAAVAGEEATLTPAEITPTSARPPERGPEPSTTTSTAARPTATEPAATEPAATEPAATGPAPTEERPVWLVVLAAMAVTAMVVQVVSWAAAALPGRLAVRRAAYLVLLVLAGTGAWAVNRRRSWITGPASAWALAGAGVVAVGATAYLFGLGT